MADSSLLISRLLNKSRSGVVELTVPRADGKGYYDKTIKGCLTDNIVLRLGNNWQAVLPSTDAITKASNIAGINEELLAWLGSTQAAWMGSEPLTLGLTFYLFSLNDSSRVKEDVIKLAKLAVPTATSATSVIVHGGYKPNVLSGNKELINNSIDPVYISIKIGGQFTLTNMLLVDISPEYSIVEVKSKNPLYAKVTANFRTYKTMTSAEIETMLGGK